ncbi:response regulator receiver domain-containing protein [Nocardiopsis sp. L17-MgMaSL7]|nr:response regulator receiver domain-containing protein [Nocardiopsis sp. L17-MgMaSL7]
MVGHPSAGPAADPSRILDSSGAATLGGGSVTGVNALPARVLVVEDDEVIRELIRLNLELEGFEVFTAMDGQDCLDRVGHVEPDVITMDVMMPRLDGWSTVERLRSDGFTRRIVMVTARAQTDDRRRGERIGVDEYLTKPFDPDELVDLIRALLGEGDGGIGGAA